MGYRRMNINDLRDLHRRLASGQSINEVSIALGFDRKTIRRYRDGMQSSGILSSTDLIENLENALRDLLPKNERECPIQDGYLRKMDEIKKLTTRKEDPLKLKTAFLVMKQKYNLLGSYESFKVFAKKNHLTTLRKKPFPRIEMDPGKEIQIDYCKCGLFQEPGAEKRRTVYAYIAKLSSSRLPFVEFTYSQDQASFVGSNIKMVEFYGGVTEYLTIDNLKAGVIKAHIYDPQLNNAYAEFAKHYGTFINPCIPGHAKGKAKVERQVQEVRELFRRLKEVHPTYTLKELNKAAGRWCCHEYGMKTHGTTGLKPTEDFRTVEKSTLRALNPVRFEVPLWKSARVHMDQFFSFNKQRFSLPSNYRQKTVHCRQSGRLLKIYDADYVFIRQYVISTRKVHIQSGDFPKEHEAIIKGSYPHYLIRQATGYGPGVRRLIEAVLKPQAFINARCARGILNLIDKHKEFPLLQQVCRTAAEKKIRSPKQLKILLENEQNQKPFEFIVPQSATGQAMIRNIEEYI